MGRSANSRNRVFTAKDGGIITERGGPLPSWRTRPSSSYAPVRVLGKTTIVTNGDQTDTIYDHLAGGQGLCQGAAHAHLCSRIPPTSRRASRAL